MLYDNPYKRVTKLLLAFLIIALDFIRLVAHFFERSYLDQRQETVETFTMTTAILIV
jgi:hypothetical protein